MNHAEVLEQGTSLRRNRDFRFLWSSFFLSNFGTMVSQFSIPLLAIMLLKSGALEVGFLTAASYAPWLFIGLPAGAWVDRLPERPVLIAIEVARTGLLGLVVIGAFAGGLTLWHLYAAVGAMSCLTVFSDLAFGTFVRAIADPAQLMGAQSSLQVIRSVTGISGPGVGGLVAQGLGYEAALVTCAAAFLVSAVALSAIRPRRLAAARKSTLWKEISAGVSHFLRNPCLRVIAAASAVSSGCLAALQALVIVFLRGDVGLTAGLIGLLTGLGGVGGLVGSAAASRLAVLVGPVRTLWLPVAVTAPFGLLLPFTVQGPGVLLYVAGASIPAFGFALFSVSSNVFVLSTSPPELLGRALASLRLCTRGSLPIGALIGGILGQQVGPRAALFIVMAAWISSPIILVFSPIRRMRSWPDSAP